MEDLVYEEFDTENHEVLAICVENSSVSVGVSLFLSDREVEYYWERFPQVRRILHSWIISDLGKANRTLP